MDDRDEILGGIEGEPREMREHRIRAQAAHEQRIAVGRRSGRGFGADRSGAPGAVFDHDRLAGCLGQPLRDDAGERIGKAARRERHDDLDRSRRVVLAPGGSSRERGDAAQRSGE